jgi:hypothetical protein
MLCTLLEQPAKMSGRSARQAMEERFFIKGGEEGVYGKS